MITVEVDPSSSVAILKPQGMITESDCETVTGIVDPYIDEKGHLDGVIVQARKFPGWDSFKHVSSHMRFKNGEHEKVPRVAVVSDTVLPDAEKVLGEHFTHAQVATFSFQDFERAKRWVKEATRQ